MDLLLVRHAEAEPAGTDQSDFERRLTERGAQRFTQSVRGLAKIGVEVDLVLHSPLVRAVETARLLDTNAEVCDALAEPPAAALMSRIAERGANCVALVGHEPWMADLCALLLTGGRTASSSLGFRKGGMAWLRGQARFGAMSLIAFLPPKVSRRLK